MLGIYQHNANYFFEKSLYVKYIIPTTKRITKSIQINFEKFQLTNSLAGMSGW
jgi:hypothetical protein